MMTKHERKLWKEQLRIQWVRNNKALNASFKRSGLSEAEFIKLHEAFIDYKIISAQGGSE